MSEEQKQIDTGGPAFPLNWEDKGEYWAFGMTLRDYFAAKAMQGMIGGNWPTNSADQENIAEFSYELADAMMKERDK